MTAPCDRYDCRPPYWISSLECECELCGSSFVYRATAGDDLVKFEEVGGRGERWLPTYGPGGYLDLLTRLVPTFSLSEEIRPQVAKAFDAAFRRYQVRSADGNSFSVSQGPICPNCGSRSLKISRETIAVSPPVEWMCYTEIPGGSGSSPDRE
jgi:hypothetical protein